MNEGREDTLELAAQEGWPELTLPKGRTVAGTRTAWVRFSASANQFDVLMARILLLERWGRRLGDCPLAARPEDAES